MPEWIKGLQKWTNFGLDLATILLVATAIISIFLGAGRLGIAFLGSAALILIIRGFWNIAIYGSQEGKDNIDRVKKWTNLMIAAGAILFPIVTYLVSIPIFFADGTNECKAPEVFINDTNYVVILDDLKLRHVGERIGFVTVRTKITPDNQKMIECQNCSVGPYPKPDGNQDGIQEVETKVTFDRTVTSFSYVQQVHKDDYLIPLIGNSIEVASACTCTTKVGSEEFDCKTDPALISWVDGTTLFDYTG